MIKQVVKGFVPVDEFGNVVKKVPRAPEIKIEGMPLTKRESSVVVTFASIHGGSLSKELTCVGLVCAFKCEKTAQ